MNLEQKAPNARSIIVIKKENSMFYLLGLAENIKTLILLTKAKTENSVTDFSTLKKGYLQFLKNAQPTIWHPDQEDNKFLYDSLIIQELLMAFTQDSTLSDHNLSINVAPHESMENALDRMRSAINFMRLNQPELFVLFDMSINTLFYASSSNDGGGSISSAIGIIWCANRKTWTLMDCVELLIHEMTHTLIFLDELRFQHYVDFNKMTEKENFAVSAILKTPRPLDKTFHSLIVATEILQLRLQFLGEPIEPKVHPDSKTLLENTKKTLLSINNAIQNKDIASDRFKEILEKVAYKLLQSEQSLKKMKEIEFLG
jgi:hypothetical protein